MCVAIALTTSELPLDLVKQHRLADRVYEREGLAEFQFHWWQVPTILPVRWDGKLQILTWGCKSRRNPAPYGGWISLDDLDAGILSNARAEEVVIPANLGHQKGTWFVINEGIRGFVIHTREGPAVYMLMKPATNYFRNMTEQTAMMPVLLDQVI